MDQKVETCAQIKNATAVARRSDMSGLAVLTDKHFHVLDDDGNQLATLEIPANWKRGTSTVYPYAENKFAFGFYSGQQQEFYWYETGEDPSVVAKPIREESVAFGNSLAEIGPVEVAATAMSSPVASFFAPTTALKVVPIVLPLVLAFVTWRLEKRPSRQFFWSAFSFVLGLSGFLGYWFHRKRTQPLLSCARCDETIPKPKTQCPSCSEALQLPARLGTEIFA